MSDSSDDDEGGLTPLMTAMAVKFLQVNSQLVVEMNVIQKSL
jgi:hypothetical protein